MPEQIIPQRERLALPPFDTWTYEDAVREMKAAALKDYDTRKAYAVDDDHWQDGREWIGPGDPKINLTIEKQFSPEDAIGQVLANVSNAFSEPQIVALPYDEADRPLADEALEILRKWWVKRKLHEHILERQRTSAWAGLAGLRLWVPARFLETDGTTIFFKDTSSIEEALDYLYVVAPFPDAAMVLTDDNTQDQIAVFFDEEVDTNQKPFKKAELIYLDPDRDRDEDADTIIRVVYSNRDKVDKRATLALGGRLLFSEMKTDMLLTDPVIRTQRQLNLITTLITRISETAAFRERYTTNAKPQGLRTPYTEGASLPDGAFIERDDEEREWLVTPQPRTLGANTTTELVGMPQFDDTGQFLKNETPGIEVVEPVDPKAYLDAADGTRRRVLRMCGQGHLAGTSNAETSGIAYEQARAVFEKDLNKRRTAEEGMLRELLMSVLAFAEDISDQPGLYTSKLRMSVDQPVNPGPRSPDLVRLDLESYEAGTLSRETTIARLGIEDVEAEMERLHDSPLFILDLLAKATEALGEFYSAESIVLLLENLGLDTETIQSLEVKEVMPPIAPAAE